MSQLSSFVGNGYEIFLVHWLELRISEKKVNWGVITHLWYIHSATFVSKSNYYILLYSVCGGGRGSVLVNNYSNMEHGYLFRISDTVVRYHSRPLSLSEGNWNAAYSPFEINMCIFLWSRCFLYVSRVRIWKVACNGLDTAYGDEEWENRREVKKFLVASSSVASSGECSAISSQEISLTRFSEQ
jgi:hypothetical protein